MRLLLLRHGPVCVPSDYCYGHLEVPLQEPCGNWVGAARQNIEQHLGSGFRGFSSPSGRALRLAEMIWQPHWGEGSGITTDERLRELNFGAFEGRRWRDIPPSESLDWTESAGQRPCPGGESFVQLRARVGDILAEWEHAAQDVFCVCHGGTIRAVLQTVLELPFAALFRMRVDFAAFTLLEWGAGGCQVAMFNQVLPGYSEVL